jgi:nanoRNase/pAp phosphatase (c-di-AMP/oligoRNAs hydrolase)
MKNAFPEKDISAFDNVFSGAEHLLIIVHTNPDPDAIASALALKHIVVKRFGIDASIGYSGNIARAENRAMVRELKIQMKQLSKIAWSKYDRVALVDTQPGSGNNVLPKDIRCNLVFDHHPPRRKPHSDLSYVYPELGVLATLLIEWLEFLEIEIPTDLATALVYAISSESQNLNREVHERDIDAYLYVYTRSNLKKLAQIMVPQLPRPYYVSVAKTLRSAVTYRNLICAHLGEISAAEIVAEMADFLVRHERISWSFCTGRFKQQLILSLRSRNSKAEAGTLVKKLVGNSKTVGGHGMSAGGFIDIGEMKNDDIELLENRLRKDFAALLNCDDPEWKGLLGDQLG